MTKKKSILAFTLALMLVMPLSLPLTACGNKHNFSSEWSTSATMHWHACTDKDCTETADSGNHTFGAWSEKSTAGVHTNKIEARNCTVCGYEDTRPVEGTSYHAWAWKANDVYHWEETTCDGANPQTRNKEQHTWEYVSYNETSHKKVATCSADKHARREEAPVPHRYDSVEDTTCNDCGYVRTLAGKGSIKAISLKTYNSFAQGISKGDYTVDSALGNNYEIQYKNINDPVSAYSPAAPINAGTYNVRIYFLGDSNYPRGEVASAEFTINQLEVEVNAKYIVPLKGTENNEVTLKEFNVNVTETTTKKITLIAKGQKYAQQGRYTIDRTSNEASNIVFNDANFKPLPKWEGGSVASSYKIVAYNDAELSVEGFDQIAEYPSKCISLFNGRLNIKKLRVNSGILKVGDYLMCEGVEIPLKVTGMCEYLHTNNPYSEVISTDGVIEINFDPTGLTVEFCEAPTADNKLINKTFTKVKAETLAMQESTTGTDGKRYTKTEYSTIDTSIAIGESRYLIFTHTVEAGKTETLRVSQKDGVSGYEGVGGITLYYFDTKTNTIVSGLNGCEFAGGTEGTTYTVIAKLTRITDKTINHSIFGQFSEK